MHQHTFPSAASSAADKPLLASAVSEGPQPSTPVQATEWGLKKNTAKPPAWRTERKLREDWETESERRQPLDNPPPSLTASLTLVLLLFWNLSQPSRSSIQRCTHRHMGSGFRRRVEQLLTDFWLRDAGGTG